MEMRRDESADRCLNDAIADEMLDRLDRFPDMARIRHTVQITSFGGSGTTALSDHLLECGADLPRTPGGFPFKHQRVPPVPDAVPPGFRVVYPFGDPRNAVVSVFRRGFQGGHYRGMHLRRPTERVASHLTDLEHFLEGGVDEFGLEDHFERWYARDIGTYPVLFVRYEELPNVWSEVSEFVGLPAGSPAIVVHARASEWQTLPHPLREAVDRMYGGLARRLDLLRATELR